MSTQPSLPWSGRTPTSRHNSYKAAVSVTQTRQWKTDAYLEYLQQVGRASDHQAAKDLGWPLSSICSIRNGWLRKGRVEARGSTLSPYGKDCTLWACKQP